MRSFTRGWFLPAVILATGCLAAGCGSAAKDAAGNLASKAATATASPEETPTGETPTGPSIPTVTRTPTARATVTATATVTASAAPAAPVASPTATGTESSSGSTPIWPWILLGVAVLAALTGWIVHASRRRSATAAGWQSRLIDAYAKGSALHDAMGVAESPGQFAAPDAAAGGPTSSGGPMTSRRSSTRCARRSRTTVTAPGSRTHSFHCRQPARPWTPSGLLAAPTRSKLRSSAAGWTLSRCPSARSGPATRSTADFRYRTASPWRR